MTSMQSRWRTAMVCAGWPSSQRNLFGATNQTRPLAVNGWASVVKVRVWMNSADQDWMLVCALSQAVTKGFQSLAAAALPVAQATTTNEAKCARPRAQERGMVVWHEHHPRRSTMPESLRP